MFCVFTEVIGLDDTVTFEKNTPHFQLLPMSKVDQSKLGIHEVPPLQYPKSHIILGLLFKLVWATFPLL